MAESKQYMNVLKQKQYIAIVNSKEYKSSSQRYVS